MKREGGHHVLDSLGVRSTLPSFKDYNLPLIFLKRLSDVFEDEVTDLADEYRDAATARLLVEKDHKLVRFFVPEIARWDAIAKKTTGAAT